MWCERGAGKLAPAIGAVRVSFPRSRFSTAFYRTTVLTLFLFETGGAIGDITCKICRNNMKIK